MITSAAEFVALRTSQVQAEYGRAAHDEAPIEVWREVIADYPEMRQWVILNKTVPIEILRQLARDPDPQVRDVVACKRKLTRELFELLAADPVDSVRATLARNAKLPRDLLEALTSDPEPWVAEVATIFLEKRS